MSRKAASELVCPATVCPVCGGPNRCAMADRHNDARDAMPCWCTRVVFPQELLDRIPAPARGVACVCEQCAASVAATPGA